MQYDFNLAANAAIALQLSGKFFKYKSGTGAIRVKATKGGYIDLLPGQGVYDIEFNDLSIVDISGNANKGVILAGFDDFRDDRIAGTVDVVDGGKARTIANVAFSASVNPTSDATTAPAAYLKNPAGSGKNLIVKAISASFSATQAYGLAWVTGVTGTDNTVVSLVSKSQNGTFVGKVFTHTTGVSATGAQNSMATAILSANTTDRVTFQEPIVIAPGMQLKIFGTVVSSSMTAVLEGIEDPI